VSTNPHPASIRTPDIGSVTAITSDEQRAVVQRIIASKHFAKAPLLSSFLLYTCRRVVDDGLARISEHEIGVNVFQRGADFDPRQDNIVRTYARHLRKRLQDYYVAEGKLEAVRVDIPKGSYVPVFRASELQPTDSDLAICPPNPAQATSLPSPSWPIHARRLAVALLLLIAYSITLCLLDRRTLHSVTTVEPRSPSHTLWTSLFRPEQDTFVVPGDTGFVILQQANHRTFSLAEYLNWSSAEGSERHLAMAYLKDETYTSVLNLQIISQLQRLPESIAERFLIRAAKNVRLDDLRDGNAILLGSSYSNPWDEIFSDKLNFHFVSHPNDGRFWIINEHPAAEESGIYESTTNSTTHKTYAVVAFLHNLNKNGHVLLLEGLDAAGTQAAADMVLNGSTQNAGVDLNRYADRGSFELLLEVNSLDPHSHVTSTQIIASRTYGD
jgi:hypothetical protein